MKTLALSLAIVSALVTSAHAAQSPSNLNGVQTGGPVLPPGITYSTTFPWETRVADPAHLDRLLTELRVDIEAAAPALTALNESTAAAPSASQPVAASSTVPQPASVATLLSRDLSVNLGQNLSTSLAVPTAVPWSTWGNGPGAVLMTTSDGTVMAVPTFPPRTAWGNGPGMVVTTPGGAVFSIMPGPTPVGNANLEATREALRQLSIVQDDLDRVLQYLAKANITNTITPSSSPSPVYLTPTGRR